MKKLFVLLIAICLCFCGCANTEPQIDPDLIIMEVVHADTQNVVFEVTNNSKYKIEFGEDYYIEFKDGENWVPLEETNEYFFNMIAYSLEPGGWQRFDGKTEPRYGALSSGTYRIAKDFTLLNEDEIPCGSKRPLAEIEVQAIKKTTETTRQNLDIKAEGNGWNRAFGAKISNNSDREIKLSAMWELFYEVEGEFKKHSYIRGIGYDDTMIAIAGGESYDAGSNCEGTYGLLPVGKYRIDFQILFDDDYGFEKEQTISAEFEVTGLEKEGTSFLWDKSADITESKITAFFKNDWGEEIRYGEDYFIQRLEGGDWVTVEPLGTPAFDQVLHTLNAGEIAEWSADISLIYGELPAGSYRLAKPVFTDAENYINGMHYVFFEFEIE